MTYTLQKLLHTLCIYGNNLIYPQILPNVNAHWIPRSQFPTLDFGTVIFLCWKSFLPILCWYPRLEQRTVGLSTLLLPFYHPTPSTHLFNGILRVSLQKLRTSHLICEHLQVSKKFTTPLPYKLTAYSLISTSKKWVKMGNCNAKLLRICKAKVMK